MSTKFGATGRLVRRVTGPLGGGCGLLAAVLVAFAPFGPAVAAPDRPLVFIPGLLGSKLCRDAEGAETVVWGTIGAFRHLVSLRLDVEPDAAGGVRPCGLVREVSILGPLRQEFYGPIIDRLGEAGYQEGRDLFIFDYDWRQSVFDNAARLGAFVEAELPADARFDILSHSMGGLVGRVYLLEEGGAPRVQRFVTAGTPWWGSVKLFELLEQGYGPATPLIGGIEAVRRTILSFPSLYELAPAYDGCCASVEPGIGFDAGQPSTWPALGWDGVEADAMPDPAEVASRRARLAEIVETPLPDGIEEALVIGVDQRTLESFRVQRIGDIWEIDLKSAWSGDGVVVPASARFGESVVYPTSFSVHNAILNDPDVQAFVLAALRNGPEEALRTVPVRPRDKIETALGRLTALVGVAVATDAPAYPPGEEVQVRVILRPDGMEPIDPGTIALRAEHPDGTIEPVPLSRDPAGTDNPFEQVFEGRLRAGGQAGPLRLRSELDVAGSANRIAELTILIVSP
jgi:pimeloyl-ACP methyl ester carboxylesterase